MLKIHFERQADGFTVEVKGDPQRIAARREAYEAWCAFVDKAEEAGLSPRPFLRRLFGSGRTA